MPQSVKDAFCDEAIHEANSRASQLKGTPYVKQQMLLTAMYMRGLEIAASSQLVDENEHFSSFSILLRSLLELHFDFLLVFTVDDYFEIMRVKEIPSEIVIEKNLGHLEKAKELEAELQWLKEQGYRKMNMFEKSEHLAKDNADSYREIYQIIYRSLCAETHNSSNSILESHLVKKPDGYYAKTGSSVPESRRKLYRGQVGRSICMMSKLIHLLHKTGKESIFDGVLEKHGMKR